MTARRIVSQDEWEAARQELLVKEKAATRERDALAAERRRLPMVRIEKDYAFEGPDGPASLLDLFAGRRQLILYRFFFDPGMSRFPEAGCPGCSMFADQIGHLAHFHARDTSLVLVSGAPVADIERYRARGWAGSPPGTPTTTTSPPTSASTSGSASSCSCAGRRRGLPHLLHPRPRGRGARQRLDLPRPDPVRAPGGLGGLARGHPAGPALRVVAPARRVRRRRVTAPARRSRAT